MKRLLTPFLLLSLTILMPHAMAQDQGARPWEQTLASVMTAEDMESDTWEDTYDLLCTLEQQPLDLNLATREELEALPFLTERQVEGIMEYMYNYGPMKSMNELRMIRVLDFPQIELLRFFTYVEDESARTEFPRLNDILKYGRHEVMANVRVPFYRRKGDDDDYLGYPYRHWIRYQMSYHDNVKLGVVGSQDAGEPFLANRNKAGYDFYSYYLQVKHLGMLENAVVGKYKLSAGMGLVLNNSFGLGKLATLQQLGRSTNTIRPHASRSETNHFQGTAATVRVSPAFLLTAFLSYRPVDATLNADGTARTIVGGGYHRTATEMEKKYNTHIMDIGARLGYRHRGLHAGMTALYSHLDRRLVPDTNTPYRRHYAQGRDFMNVSADYGYLHPRFALNGETAVNRDGALATINSLSVQAADGLSLLLLQRFYSYRYTALYARSMSEGGHIQNESGVYMGATWQPSPRLRLQAYTDYAYFPWARYGVSQSSYAWDNLLTASYNRGSWSLGGRYRLHLRQHDNDTKDGLDNQIEHRGRLTLGWQRAKGLSTATQADAIITTDSQWGYMLSQTASCQWRTFRLSGNAGYFHTTDYAARLYVYERGPLYNFSFPAYYGEGLRLSLMAQTTIARRLTLTAKLGFTHYTDRNIIGSGLQQIDSPTQTDLDLQVRWKL